jgi:cyclopropane-fatty-acyl-phospholipid synthase
VSLLSPTRRRVIPSPSAGIWPGLFDRPRVPVHAVIARSLVKAAVSRLPMTVRLPDGSRWGRGGPELQVRSESFFDRLGRDGLIGFGEAWMTGELTAGGWVPGGRTIGSRVNEATDELAAALTVMASRLSVLVPKPLQKLRDLWQHRQPDAEENTPTQARDNIHRHYDLSNELFELFLDPTMTYSSAWYVPGDDPAADLQRAQLRKIDGVLDLAKVRPGMNVLEIGSGWGALAIRAVQERDVTVTTLTLSEEQKALADKRIAAAGLSDRIEVRLEDYRAHAAAHAGDYDAVVSVEMIEAVGEKYWPAYFSAVDRMLRPNGWFGIQAITMDHARLLATRKTYTWVHKYIFPGGLLPSLPAIDAVLDKHTGLRMLETRRLGRSYDRTLEQWRHRFNDNLDQVADLGFDETFVRMWNFYLAYSEAGFAAGYIDDWQLGIGRI